LPRPHRHTQLWNELRRGISDALSACRLQFNTLPKFPTNAEQDLRPNFNFAVFHRGESSADANAFSELRRCGSPHLEMCLFQCRRIFGYPFLWLNVPPFPSEANPPTWPNSWLIANKPRWPCFCLASFRLARASAEERRVFGTHAATAPAGRAHAFALLRPSRVGAAHPARPRTRCARTSSFPGLLARLSRFNFHLVLRFSP